MEPSVAVVGKDVFDSCASLDVDAVERLFLLAMLFLLALQNWGVALVPGRSQNRMRTRIDLEDGEPGLCVEMHQLSSRNGLR